MATVEDNESNSGIDARVYFADLPYESRDFAASTFAFADSWTEWIENTGIATRWEQNRCLYQGVDPQEVDNDGFWNSDSFSITGENGELVNANYNDSRNLMQHLLVITCGTPPNIIAKAINDDASSLVAAQAFEGVFSYYMTTHKSGRLLKQSRISVEYALIEDTGYMLVEWDKQQGKPLGVQTQKVTKIVPQETIDPITGATTMTAVPQEIDEPIVDERGQTQLLFEGDLYFKARSPWDVFFDPGCQDEDESDWALIRDQVNKFELAKRFQKHAVRILGATEAGTSRLRTWRRGFTRPKKTNLIDVWKFYHRPTPGMPKGRYALLLDASTVLEDMANPYDRIPLFSVKAMECLGTMLGYAPMNVSAPIQQSRNILSSSMMTNYAMFGVQNVAVKDADQFDVTEIAGSMNVLRYSDAPPQALQLAAQANGIEEHYDRLGRVQETDVGVNSVMRGDPEASLKSGKALGIVQAAGVQYNSALAASYAQFLKDVGNFMLFCFRCFLKSERITQIIGKNEEMQSVTWDKDTFGPIDRVEAELVDPAMRTIGYKTDLGMFMVQSGLTTTPQEFLTVVTTGQLKPLYRSQLTELNCIHQENREITEAVATGRAQFQKLQQAAQTAQQAGNAIALQAAAAQMQQLMQSLVPPVDADDNHELHIMEHKIVKASPATRRDPFLMALADAHIAVHKQYIAQAAAQQMQAQAMQQNAGQEQPKQAQAA